MKQRIPTKEGALIKSCPFPGNRKSKTCQISLFGSRILGFFERGSGQYIILPKGVKIFNALYSLLGEYIVGPLGFEEVILPKIASVEVFRKAGILDKWNGYLISAKPFSSTRGVKEEYILDPLQCTVFYRIFEGKRIDVSKGPVKWFDKSGPTYRNEDLGKIRPSIKQREFHRAEFIYLGKKAQIIEIRENCILQLEKLCSALGLKYRVVVGANCYHLEKSEIKKPASIEEIPIKDLEIFCPSYKRKGNNGWLEVAGCSVLAEKLTSKFDIKSKYSETLWSGCIGIGMERFMFAILSNYGTEFDNFPAKLKGQF